MRWLTRRRICARPYSVGELGRAHVIHRRATLWSGQHARGLVPTQHLCGAGGHLDLRDNVLLGSVPACAWSLDSGRDALLLSRNLLSVWPARPFLPRHPSHFLLKSRFST
jgi:hypothetical protein